MFARISTLEGSPESVEAATASARDQVFPAAQQLAGFKGMLACADRSSGKVIAITFWETEEHLRESEEAANSLRSQAATDASAQIVAVDRLEVVFNSMM